MVGSDWVGGVRAYLAVASLGVLVSAAGVAVTVLAFSYDKMRCNKCDREWRIRKERRCYKANTDKMSYSTKT